MTALAVDSVDAVRDRVRDAVDRRTGLRVLGRGSWLDAGRPVSATESLATRDLSGITEYVPGDLTLTARAGTTLGEVREATAAHGQWLALDPHGSDSGTLGATIATASAGPLATAFGTPRDLVLGVEFVTGDGVVARGGGRVVKNVAGFDLTRLMIGSWGTLGVITEVTVRLHARPEADESIVVPLSRDLAEPSRVRTLLRRLPFVPYACEILNDSLANQILGLDSSAAIVRLGGNHEAVAAQRSAFIELGETAPIPADTWQRLRLAEPNGSAVIRLSTRPSELDRAWAEAARIASACPGTLVLATPLRGVVRCIVPPTPTHDAHLRGLFGTTTKVKRIVERLPGALWSAVGPSPIADHLSAGIKRTFDPHGVLNPGIFGENQ